MNEILRFMQKHDERTDGRTEGHGREIIRSDLKIKKLWSFLLEILLYAEHA